MTPGPEGGAPRTALLHRAPPEAVFVLAAVSQYTGIAIAVSLFEALGAPAVAWLCVVFAAAILVAARAPDRARGRAAGSRSRRGSAAASR